MQRATLLVSRVNEAELRFVLQSSQTPQTAFMQASTFLHPEQRQKISQALRTFAECLEGFPDDEPKLSELGEIFFQTLIPRPIRESLRRLAEPLVIMTDDPTLPWEIFYDGVSKEFLALKFPIARQWIAREQMAGLLRLQQVDMEGFSVLVIADPTGDLPGARDEGEALSEFFKERGTCDFLFGTEASWENIQRHLISKPYSVIHYCGHVDYDPTTKLSSLRLHSGQLSTREVLEIFKGYPLVFLNACSSDLRNQTHTGSAWTESFAQAFMIGNENGVAAAVIGTMWSIPDEPEEAGREFSMAFYRHLLAGGSIGEAMRSSRAMARARQWGPMVWGPYVLYGDPCLEPFRKRAAQQTVSVPTAPQPEREASSKQGVIEEKAKTSTRAAHPMLGDLEGANPLDTAARRVFHTALQEMLQMEQGGLGSMHMLIGLCESGMDLLAQALREKDVITVDICEEARQRAKALIPSQEQGFGISLNVARMFVLAAQRAKLFRRETITAEDLLAALLQCEDCEAVHILASFDISPQGLLNRLPSLPPLPKLQFDGPTYEAIQHATSCARQAHLSFIGTPHLLIGLIRTGGLRTITLLRKRGVNLEQLCEVLRAGVGQGSPDSKRGNGTASLDLRPRCRAILQRAYELAQDTDRGEIAETHLLQALLEDQSGLTAEVLRKVGADPEKLLVDLHDVEATASHFLRLMGIDLNRLLTHIQHSEE